MKRNVRDEKREGMSGEMLAFLCFMGFTAFCLIVPVMFPVGFKASWDTLMNIFLAVFLWALNGWSGQILILGSVVVGWILLLGAAYMVLEKVYRFLAKIASKV